LPVSLGHACLEIILGLADEILQLSSLIGAFAGSFTLALYQFISKEAKIHFNQLFYVDN
jgi:hypothetical protein